MEDGMEPSVVVVDEEQRKPNRDDIAPGLLMMPSQAIIDDPDKNGPLICFAFHANGDGCLPKGVQDILWVIHSAMCLVQKGEKKAFINLKGRPFQLLFGSTNTQKPVILSKEQHVVLPELDIQIRVHKMGNEHYMVLIVRTHLAFSLRHAIMNLLTKVDLRVIDGCRLCINTHAKRMREMLGSNYVNEIDQISSIDWLNVPNNYSFHVLFSVKGALQWILSHYKKLHPDEDDDDFPELEGFGDIRPDANISSDVEEAVEDANDEKPSHLNGQFSTQGRQYEMKLDELIDATHHCTKKRARGRPPSSKKNQKTTGKNHRSPTAASVLSSSQPGSPALSQMSSTTSAGGGGSSQAGEDDGENEDGEDEKRDAILSTMDLGHPTGWILDEEDGITGYPSTSIIMKVALKLEVGGPFGREKFNEMIHMLPTTASMRMLQMRLNINELNLNQLLLTDEMDHEQCDALLHGTRGLITRPFYSNGDSKWARGFEAALDAVDEKEIELKERIGRLWTEMGVPLARTRADGSDTYTNRRAGIYATRMMLKHDVTAEDDTECTRFFEDFITKTRLGKREGCLTQEALMAYTHVLQRTNVESWNLRPDNLFLLNNLIVSDLMLAMNFHGGAMKGGENGIGAPLFIHDGGGAYRTMIGTQHNGGMIYTKSNGCGADFVISVLSIFVIEPSSFDSRIEQLKLERRSSKGSILHQVQRSSEMGLFTLTCNVFKGHEGEEEIVGQVIDTSARIYTTEMRLHDDSMAGGALQAIVTSIPRMTRDCNPQRAVTTAGNDKTNTRVPVTLIQMIVGYLVLCTNNLAGKNNMERVKTLCKVIRGISSCADPLDAALSEENFTANDIKYGKKTYVPSGQDAHVFQDEKIKGIFLSSIGVAHFTAFMQWTGMLGKIPMSFVSEEILDSFYAQLGLSECFLNRIKYAPEDRTRCFEMSKARGITASLLITSVQSVLAGGQRVENTLLDATCRNAQRLMFKGLPVSMLPWIMADTMENMFRTDFMILMQYLAKKFEVPSGIPFDAVLEWLRVGNADHCRVLAQWLERKLPNATRLAPLESEEMRAELLSGIYLIHPHLCITINPMDPGDIMGDMATKIGSFIYQDDVREFKQFCQMHDEAGEGVIQYILGEVIREQMAWPAVFGTEQTLPNFWFGSPPLNSRIQQERLILRPIQMIRTDSTKVYLAIDIRWLLMMNSIVGKKPCQGSRHVFISLWIRHFYKWCMPRCLIYSDVLITGLPVPKMRSGFLMPRVIETDRKVLGRPSGKPSKLAATLSPTGMIEDIAVVEERYQKARWLKVHPDRVPTNSVSYSFPYRVWVPCAHEDDMSICVSLRYDGDGRFLMCNKMDKIEVDVTARPAATTSSTTSYYLDARITENVRPLCFFDRPGVLLVLNQEEPAVILRYDHMEVSYLVRTANVDNQEVDPLDMETLVCKIGQSILIKPEAVSGTCSMFVENKDSMSAVQFDDLPEDALLLCKLRVPDDETLEGLIPLELNIFHNIAAEDDMMMDLIDSMAGACERRITQMTINIPIDQVVRLYKEDQEEEEDEHIFHGVSHQE